MLQNREIFKLDISHRAITVYMYLRDRADKDGRCFPSVTTIARDLKLSPRTIQRAFTDLEKEQLIRKEERWRTNGGRSSSLYLL